MGIITHEFVKIQRIRDVLDMLSYSSVLSFMLGFSLFRHLFLHSFGLGYVAVRLHLGNALPVCSAGLCWDFQFWL